MKQFVCNMIQMTLTTQHCLSEFHQVIVVSKSHIELTGGELSIMRQIDALISELLSNFINTVKSTNNKPLKMELRRNAHV